MDHLTTAYDVDNITENPLLVAFVDAHHSSSMIWVRCSEVVSFKLDASKKFMRCIPNENGEFIGSSKLSFNYSSFYQAALTNTYP